MSKQDRILGLGSPHGDDGVGWQVVERLARSALAPPARAIASPVDLLMHLEGCERLWLVDGFRAGAPVGTLHRLEWPDPRLRAGSTRSTHGFDLVAALELAARLERLPSRVVLFGVELGQDSPGTLLDPAVRRAVPRLADGILEEVRAEVRHA